MSFRPSISNFRRWDVVLFWLYLLFLVVAYGTALNDADPDLWHRFMMADYLFHTGYFAPGTTYGYLGIPEIRPDFEWGGGVVLYVIYLLGGGTGIVVLKLMTLGATLALAVRAGLRTRPPTMLNAFFYSVVLLALLPSFLSTLRSQAATHIFFALWVLWFQQERHGSKTSIWAYILTMALWTNLHGGYLLGLAWLAAIGGMEFLTGGDWIRRMKIFALCLLATLANPFGYKLWPAVFAGLFVPRPGFEEWAPVPWLHDVGLYAGYKVLVLWSAAVVCAHVYRVGWAKCDRIAVIMLGLILIPSLEAARHTSIFAIAAGGLIPPLFPPEKSLHDIQELKPWLHRFVVRGVLIVLPLIYVWRLAPTNEGLHLAYPPNTCPVGAINYLRNSGTTGNLLINFNSGGYATWKLRGRMRVSMSGRFEAVFPYSAFEKVQRFFAAGDHWRDALSDPPPDAVLVDRPAPVYPEMLAEPGWTQVYQDATQAVFKPSH